MNDVKYGRIGSGTGSVCGVKKIHQMSVRTMR